MRRGLVAATPTSGYPIRLFARGIFVVARRGNLLKVKVKAPVAGSIVSFNQLLCFLDEAIDELGSSYWQISKIAHHLSLPDRCGRWTRKHAPCHPEC
jgi:hypothetical protein